MTGAVRRGLPLALLATTFAKLTYLGALLDHGAYPEHRAATTATLAVLWAMAAAVLWMARRYDLVAAVTLNTSLTCLALADVLHYRFYGDVVSMAELSSAAQVAVVAPSVFALLQTSDLFLFLDVVGAVALWLAFVRRSRPVEGPMPGRMGAGITACAAILFALTPLSLVVRDPEEVFGYQTTRREIAVALGLLPYHVYDAVTFLAHPVLGRLTTLGDGRYEALRILRERPPTSRSPLFGVAHGSNVILVMAESLAAFPIGMKWRGQPVAPRLSQFASESLAFSNFFDQTHDGTTSDGEFTSLQSLHPLASGAVATRYGANDFRGLPAILRSQGYHTFSASAEAADFWNKRQIHPQLGFSQSYFRNRYHDGEAIGLGLSDGEFFRQTLAFPDFATTPFMAYLMTLTAHHPYRLPAAHRVLRLAELEGTLLGDYLHSVNYFDRMFGELVDGLDAKGLLDSSVVVVYGDHQPFWENVHQLPRLLGFDGADPFRRWEARERLPFFIRLPGGRAARTYDWPGGHLDITPTLLSLLGVSTTREVLFGADLTARHPDRIIPFRNGDLLIGDLACIREGVDVPSGRCFDVRSGKVGQATDLAQSRVVARARLSASDAIVHGDLIPFLRRELAPRPLNSSDPTGGVVVIAHRGDSTEFPENTLASIAGAVAIGADLAEVDVRVTRDGVPVLIHDETLDRTTTGTGQVKNATLAELQRLDAGSWKAARFSGERVPTLVEAFRAAKGKIRLLLDVPVDGAGPQIAAAVREAGARDEDFAIATWDTDQRAEMHRLLPEVAIVHAEGVPDREHAWTDTFFAGQQSVGVKVFDVPNWSPQFIAAANARRMCVWVYTVNDEPLMRRLIAAGVDGIETDRPALAVRLRNELRGRR